MIEAGTLEKSNNLLVLHRLHLFIAGGRAPSYREGSFTEPDGRQPARTHCLSESDAQPATGRVRCNDIPRRHSTPKLAFTRSWPSPA